MRNEASTRNFHLSCFNLYLLEAVCGEGEIAGKKSYFFSIASMSSIVKFKPEMIIFDYNRYINYTATVTVLCGSWYLPGGVYD